MDAQERVAAFVRDHDLEAPLAYRLLDLVSEMGEVANDAAESTAYGDPPDDISIHEDELRDVLFAVLALAERLDIDAEMALEAALKKSAARIEDRGAAGSA